ncbi:hypothetical protein THRCLA_06743, partial [Thraustotheca clavata]
MTDLSCVEELTPGAASEVLEPSAILNHLQILLTAEAKKPRPGGYMTKVQNMGMQVSWRKRMVEWMIHTGKAFELCPDTVFCAIHLMDDYLAKLPVDKIVLQLVAMVAMYVASKMHETRPILMEEMELLCQNKYPRREIVNMEKQLLKVVQWRLNPPTPCSFLRDILTFESSPSIQVHLEEAALELLEACAMDYEFLTYASSTMTAAALEVVCMTQFGCSSPLASYALETVEFNSENYDKCVASMMAMFTPLEEPELANLATTEAQVTPTKKRSHSPTSIDSPEPSRKKRRVDDVSVQTTMDDTTPDNNAAVEPRKLRPKPCPDVQVRTGGFQKIEERTWNAIRSRRTTPKPISNLSPSLDDAEDMEVIEVNTPTRTSFGDCATGATAKHVVRPGRSLSGENLLRPETPVSVLMRLPQAATTASPVRPRPPLLNTNRVATALAVSLSSPSVATPQSSIWRYVRSYLFVAVVTPSIKAEPVAPPNTPCTAATPLNSERLFSPQATKKPKKALSALSSSFKSMCFSTEDPATSIDVTPDGQCIIAAFSNGSVRLFDVNSTCTEDRFGYLLGHLDEELNQQMTAATVRLKVTPDGCYCFVGCRGTSPKTVMAINLDRFRHHKDSEDENNLQKYFCNDSKLRGFADASDNTATDPQKKSYFILTGLGVQYFRLWKFEQDENAPSWSYLRQFSSMSNTALHAAFFSSSSVGLSFAGVGLDSNLKVFTFTTDNALTEGGETSQVVIPNTKDITYIKGQYAYGYTNVGGFYRHSLLEPTAPKQAFELKINSDSRSRGAGIVDHIYATENGTHVLALADGTMYYCNTTSSMTLHAIGPTISPSQVTKYGIPATIYVPVT